MNLVYLLLGSNIEPERNLPAAVAHLSRFGCVRATSAVWQTAPIGRADQPDYLNAVVLLETPLSAQELRETAIAFVEAALGRVRTADKDAPRTIDVDILLFNREILSLGQRRIPSPEILERPFVAILLAEIAPGYIHPETGQTLQQIADRFPSEAAKMRKREDVPLLPPQAMPTAMKREKR
ncbi:MAG: 2-amino-4-hydroxy-6-hydroxymethyldihydropteridine diphosphokinase [Anaerolineae bacterium]|nr:2-amino-4-hydroxy-6-hydroxymethyldihydropteridine diphosphokinase [Anaerolineae bacterium]MDW8099727.1 2-amino-4-hydroxy-6-hydroxymethyldihydropteridine diphosphokinase [Anaerolineae bacterium]